MSKSEGKLKNGLGMGCGMSCLGHFLDNRRFIDSTGKLVFIFFGWDFKTAVFSGLLNFLTFQFGFQSRSDC